MTSQKASTMIRVASVPQDQVYIRHLEPLQEQDRGSLRLPDPIHAPGSQSEQSPWWPPLMLTPEWVRDNHQRFDLMHIHFGFDAVDPQTLRNTITELRHFHKPLVYTVHDLINPHQPDATAHRQMLDILIASADALITLTDGAAAEIAAQWHRAAHVLPHPHVVDFATMNRLRRRREVLAVSSQRRTRHIGVHLKGLRANISPAILEPLARIVAEIPDTELQVNIHRQVLDPSNREYKADLAGQLLEGEKQGKWNLEAHEYFSEQELFEYLGSLDVNVLPYRFGTHSGWLEAALDTGAAIVAPDCGQYVGQQASVAPYRWDDDRVDEYSLEEAVKHQLALSSVPGMDAEERKRQRMALAEAHERIYLDLLAR